MINYKIVLVVVALAIGGICSTIIVQMSSGDDQEQDRLERQKAAACEFYKDTPGKLLSWCE
jgi:hypothetical protein